MKNYVSQKQSTNICVIRKAKVFFTGQRRIQHGDSSVLIFMMNSVEVKDKNIPWMVYILTMSANLNLIVHSYDMGSISGAILLIQKIDYLHITRLWKQLMVAGSLPGAAICTLIGARLADRFGRRISIIMAAVCFTLGSVISTSAFNRETLLIGRLLTGCGSGIASASMPVYVAECAPKHLRGRLCGVSQPIQAIGILLGTLTSALFSTNKKDGWRYIWGFAAVLALINIIAMLFCPESPRWFIQQSRKKEAMEALIRIRCRENVAEELKEIEDNIKKVGELIDKSDARNLLVRILKTRSFRRALMVGCGVQLFAQLSGVNTIIYYSGIIIQMSGVGNVTDVLWNSVIIYCASFVISILGVWVVDRVGRRKLAIIGLFGLFFSYMCLATTFLMMSKYSPRVNTTTGYLLNHACASYSQCDECIMDSVCSFCYENKPDVIQGDCLPVSNTSKYISALGACNSSLTLSNDFMKFERYCPVSFSWVAIVGLALFLVFYVIGMGPLPWTINAEIYPSWARSTGSGIAALTAWICNLLMAGTFLSMIELLGSFGVFYMIAAVAFIGSVFCIFFLPETKNKTLEEIEKLFEREVETQTYF